MVDHVCWLTANVCWFNPQTLLFKYTVWISPMGSRPVTLHALHLFLTSAIIKWWLSTSLGLRKMTTWYCYKMKIGFYHRVTWRGHSTTTKWRSVSIIRLLEGDTQPLQNEDWFLSSDYLKGTLNHYKMKIGFYHQVTWRGHSTTTKWDWVLTCCLPKGNFPCFKMRLGF